MKRGALGIALALTVLLTAGGCSRPKTIPTKTLKEIFKSSFLVNAYYESNPTLRMNDSMDIYRPILDRYGYTIRDLENTVNRFARQQSAKLSNVVEDAIQELKDQSEYLDRRLAMYDTISAQAGRMFMREVLYEPQIVVERISDTAKLRIRVPVEEGQYEVSYSYLIDSLEENRSLRGSAFAIDTAGRRDYIYEMNTSLTPRQRKQFKSPKVTMGDDKTELEIVIGNYPQRDMKRPALTIDSLRITYFLPDTVALDSMARRWYHLNIPYHAEQDAPQADSSALRPDPDGTDPVAGGDGR